MHSHNLVGGHRVKTHFQGEHRGARTCVAGQRAKMFARPPVGDADGIVITAAGDEVRPEGRECIDRTCGDNRRRRRSAPLQNTTDPSNRAPDNANERS